LFFEHLKVYGRLQISNVFIKNIYLKLIKIINSVSESGRGGKSSTIEERRRETIVNETFEQNISVCAIEYLLIFHAHKRNQIYSTWRFVEKNARDAFTEPFASIAVGSTHRRAARSCAARYGAVGIMYVYTHPRVFDYGQ